MIKHISKVLGTIAVLALCVLSGSNAYAQNRTVSGVVVDNAGLPVIGASLIFTTNSTIGTVTDIDGKFTLNVPQNAVHIQKKAPLSSDAFFIYCSD
ncbi:MAG: carboxypeptidase-like regulatory domain-containing protein [Bacteroidales bacterium]|nr:carboxypeptidase-like regulatory domain-containing protein [Bacteroidales bacterium]